MSGKTTLIAWQGSSIHFTLDSTNTEGTIQLSRSLLELAPLAAGWSMHSMQYFDWRMGELCAGSVAGQCCSQNIFVTLKNNIKTYLIPTSSASFLKND